MLALGAALAALIPAVPWSLRVARSEREASSD